MPGSSIWHHIFIVFQLHRMKDVTKFALWRDVSSEKLRMLQERSDSLVQSFPRIQQRSEATKSSVFLCFVANRFSNLDSRSAVCCHKKRAALFTQTHRFNLVVIGEPFFNGDSLRVEQCRREIALANDLISASPPLKSCSACQDGRMDEICVSVHVTIPNSSLRFRPENQIVPLFCVSFAAKKLVLLPNALCCRSVNRLHAQTGCQFSQMAVVWDKVWSNMLWPEAWSE